MFGFGGNQPQVAREKWQSQLDVFVDENQQQLAALTWGLQQEWQDLDTVLGIDLKPEPHFVACAKEDIEQLNQNTKGQLQEILGIIDGYNRETEVVIMAIGEGQVKLINFQPKITPPACFEAVPKDLDILIETLESALAAHLKDEG